MTDDWLDTGHGLDASRLSTVFSRTSTDNGGTHLPTSRPRVLRPAGPVSVSVLVAAVMLVGSAGAVYAIRESLFPSLGAATSPSVWQNPAPPDAIPASSAPSIATTASTSTTTTIPSNPVPNTPSSTSLPAVARATPTSSFDDHASGGSGTTPDDPGSDNSGRNADDSGSDDSGSDDSGSDDSGSDDSGSGRSGSGSDDASGRDDVRNGSDDDVVDLGPDPDVDLQDD